MAKPGMYQPRTKHANGTNYVFDETRKKWLVLTPEEKVRQFFLKYLIEKKNYPIGLIATEMGLEVNGVKKRADIVVYKNSKPYIVVECKAPQVKINQATADQVAAYNMTLRVPYVILTNGGTTFIIKLDDGAQNWQLIQDVPSHL